MTVARVTLTVAVRAVPVSAGGGLSAVEGASRPPASTFEAPASPPRPPPEPPRSPPAPPSFPPAPCAEPPSPCVGDPPVPPPAPVTPAPPDAPPVEVCGAGVLPQAARPRARPASSQDRNTAGGRGDL